MLNFGNCLGYFNATWAGIGAVESGAAAPHAFFVVKDFKASVCSRITAVEDEPVGGNNRSWAEVLLIGPKNGARSGAGSAQNAFGGVVEPGTILSGLNAFFGGLVTLGD